MKLIIDSGATKADWNIIGKGKKVGEFQTMGLNPYFVDSNQIVGEIERNFPSQIEKGEIEEIYFYGAGCSAAQQKEVIAQALKICFIKARIINVCTDIEGAAVALFGKHSGIAVILGTGMNSCIWNGAQIVDSLPSLGFILGDEGSGAHIGKVFIGKLLSGQLSNELQELFAATYHLTRSDILNSIYKMPKPNSYLADFTHFVKDNLQFSELKELVNDCFAEFFRNNITRYQDYNKYSLGCIGSVAYHFSEELNLCAARFGIKIEKIIKKPIDELVSFYCQNDLL